MSYGPYWDNEYDSITEDDLREEDSRLDAEEWQQREQDARDWAGLDRPQDDLIRQAWDCVASFEWADDRIAWIYAGGPGAMTAINRMGRYQPEATNMDIKTESGTWEVHTIGPTDEHDALVGIAPGGTSKLWYVTGPDALQLALALMECGLAVA